jgi:hypothetical protein
MGIGHTDGALAEVATRNIERAVRREREALVSLRRFNELLAKVQRGSDTRLQTALTSKPSKTMERRLQPVPWKPHFHTLINEIKVVRARVEHFIKVDEREGMPLIKRIFLTGIPRFVTLWHREVLELEKRYICVEEIARR